MNIFPWLPVFCSLMSICSERFAALMSQQAHHRPHPPFPTPSAHLSHDQTLFADRPPPSDAQMQHDSLQSSV